MVEQQTRLADLLAQVEPLSEAKVVVKTETQVKVAPRSAAASTSCLEEYRSGQRVSGAVFCCLRCHLRGATNRTGRHSPAYQINTLFGKPDWFAGVMTQRETQLNVVDTTRWIMPGREASEPYQYLVMLGNSQWGLACHELHGTELLVRDRIQWRGSAGKRPWLAGMVKDKMCALLHVQELLALLVKGVNIEGL